MESSVPWTWLSSYGKFLFHGLDCHPMESFCSIDLIVVLWIYIYIYIYFFHRLDCRLMEVSFPMDLVVALWRISGLMDLVVVLWKIFLDLIKSWESSHRLNLIMRLLVAIILLI
jgi:hypothetical protein